MSNLLDENYELAVIRDYAAGQNALFATFSEQSAKRAMFRYPRAESVEMFPGIRSLDPKYLRLTEEVATFSEKWSIDIDDHGLAGSSAITSDFRAVLTVTGVPMSPVTIPVVSNKSLREEYALADRFLTERHERIFNALFDAMFGFWRSAAVPLRKEGSTTFPMFTRDMAVKKLYLMNFLKNQRKITELFLKGNLKQLYKEYGVLAAYYIGVRTQSDKVLLENGTYKSKDREVSSLEYALTGGRSGKRGVADKRVFWNGQLIANHFAGRRRTVYGLSGSMNYGLSAIFQGFREYYLKEYAFTWKHKGHTDTERKLSRFKDFIGFDVKQHDQFVAPWLVDRIFDRLSLYVNEQICELMRLAYRAPMFQPSPWVGGERAGFWIGDPFDLSTFTNDVGLPSGIAMNPDIGKLGMTWVYLCVIDDYFKDVLEFGIEHILKGLHPSYAILNMSDDTVIATNSETFLPHLRAMQDEGSPLSPYMVLEKEEGIAFLGGIALKRHGEVCVVPNIVSFVVNFLAAEHGIRASARGDWAMGWIERQRYYSAAPLFEEVRAMTAEAIKKHLGFDIDLLARQTLAGQKIPPPEAYTEADRLVMINPDAMFYKVDINDLSPFFLDQLVAVVPAEEVYPYIRPLITGAIVYEE